MKDPLIKSVRNIFKTQYSNIFGIRRKLLETKKDW